jgi:hypothetical protein
MASIKGWSLVRFSLLCGLVSISSTVLSAQDRLDPVAMGKARASVATSRGLSAIASNPGALDLYPFQGSTLPQDLTLSIYNFGGTIGSTFFSSSEFQDIFGHKPQGISDPTRVRIAQLLQDEKLFANGAIDLISARYRTRDGGTLALHYGHRIYSRVNFPNGFVKLLQTSNIAGQNFKFSSRGIGGDWITELGLSYGKMLGSVTTPGWFPTVGIGATAKLLQGVARFEVVDNSIITIDQINVASSLQFHVRGGYTFRSAEPDGFDPGSAISKLTTALFPSTAGSGFGADVGISGVLYRMAPLQQGGTGRDAVYFGFALQGLGSITWNTNTFQRSALGIDDTLQNSGVTNEQLRRYQGTLEPISSFSSQTPAVFRAGLGVDVGAYVPEMSGRLLLDIEGEVPLNDVPGNSPDPRLAIGGDWGISDEVSLRTGVSGGGTNNFGIALGVGVRPVEWLSVDLGTSELNALFNGKRVDLAVRAAVGFRP